MRSATHLLTGLLTLTLTLAGCTATHHPAAHEKDATATATPRPPRTIELPGNSWPSNIAIAPDGTLWATESSLGFLASISRSGRITQHRLTDPLHAPSLEPSYLAIGSDGSVWFTCALDIGRITPNGKVTLFHRPPLVYGSPDAITADTDASIWYGGTTANEWRLVHITAAFSTSYVHVPLAQFAPHITGLAFGPGKRLWFTSYSLDNERGKVGYTDTHSHTKIWPTDASPGSIALGPDGALWFSETDAIGRITPSGAISYHRAPAMKNPGGIVPGPDHALWFTTSNSMGRITTAGTITLWPVHGAQELTDLVYDTRRHGFWVADAKAAVLRWFPLRS
ncbi:Vgb family protein [Streptomyces puniciscabiei]|uniref:Vgb family protein n=1 Tax=Streptomyces puniciscabiei TaxID=164348 RepID=UPI00332A3795